MRGGSSPKRRKNAWRFAQDDRLKAVREHSEGANPAEILNYMLRKFGMTVRPINHLGAARMPTHRSAGQSKTAISASVPARPNIGRPSHGGPDGFESCSLQRRVECEPKGLRWRRAGAAWHHPSPSVTHRSENARIADLPRRASKGVVEPPWSRHRASRAWRRWWPVYAGRQCALDGPPSAGGVVRVRIADELDAHSPWRLPGRAPCVRGCAAFELRRPHIAWQVQARQKSEGVSQNRLAKRYTICSRIWRGSGSPAQNGDEQVTPRHRV